VVAEWRDGTQQFFDPAFAQRWWRRMERIRGVADDDGAAGDLADLPEEEILRIAGDEGAEYVVLPTRRHARLPEITRCGVWALYRAQPLPPPVPPAADSESEAWTEQKRFVDEVVWPNIERHRKRDLTLRLHNAEGLPPVDALYRIHLTNHRFGFGCSLPHFLPPAGESRGFRPPRWTRASCRFF
jgi:hypothetical protein